MNRQMKADYDEVNAAWVGYDRTKKAMQDSRDYGELDGGRWAQWTHREVVDKGKEQLARVGILTKQGGELDKRSAAYKRGEVWIEDDGHVGGMKEKIIELRELDKEADALADMFGGGMSGLGRRY